MGDDSRWLAVLMLFAFINSGIEVGVEAQVDGLVRCGSQVCGAGAECTGGVFGAVCSCLPGMSGNPLTGCLRRLCSRNSDCASNEQCVLPVCVNVCVGTCGNNSACEPVNHRAACNCLEGYTGNPYTGCIEI